MSEPRDPNSINTGDIREISGNVVVGNNNIVLVIQAGDSPPLSR